MDGYKYYGNTRKSEKAPGGVAILVKNEIYKKYLITVCCKDTEGILGIKLEHKNTRYCSVIVSNYLPPANSKYGKDPENFFNRLLVLAYEQYDVDLLLFCGDFNARIGHIQDAPFNNSGIQERSCIDATVNSHGQSLLNFMSDSCCCVVNGRGNDPIYTCCTATGNSVVDYVILPYSDLSKVNSMRINTIDELIHTLGLEDLVQPGSAPPDHNLIQLDFNSSGHYIKELNENGRTDPKMSKKIPRKYMKNYMNNNRVKNALNEIIDNLVNQQKTQDQIDEIYTRLCECLHAEMDLYKKKSK